MLPVKPIPAAFAKLKKEQRTYESGGFCCQVPPDPA